MIGGNNEDNPESENPLCPIKGHGGFAPWSEDPESFRMETGYSLWSSTSVTVDIAEEHSIMTRIIRIGAMAVEEHGGGNQFIRVKSWPRCTPAGIVMTLFFAAMGAASAAAQAWVACGVLNAIALILMMRVMISALRQCPQ